MDDATYETETAGRKCLMMGAENFERVKRDTMTRGKEKLHFLDPLFSETQATHHLQRYVSNISAEYFYCSNLTSSCPTERGKEQ